MICSILKRAISKEKFTDKYSPFFKERIWYKNQKVVDYKDGSILLELNVNSMPEIKK